MAKLLLGAETSISMAFLVICAEKNLRLPRLFFSFFVAGFGVTCGPMSRPGESDAFHPLVGKMCCCPHREVDWVRDPQGRLKVSYKADCGALRGLLFLVGLLLSLVQARVAF